MEYYLSTKRTRGLGIEVLEVKNKCLLSKWLFKLLTEDGVWHELLTNKYLKDKTLAEIDSKPTDSPFWKGIMKVKQEFFQRISFTVGNGHRTRFWEDPWMGNMTLAAQYPTLYNIVRHKNVSVAHVVDSPHPNLQFRRLLTGQLWDVWLQLVERLMSVSLTSEPDRVKWNLMPSGIFLC